jgi:membrane associated rhomboid family serine protease
MTGEPFPDRFRRWYRMLPPAMRVLLTVNSVLYVAWVLVRLVGGGAAARFGLEYLALNPELPTVLFRPWQVLTYAFLHVQPGLWGFIAFGFNMLWLYWLGREYEEVYGSHRLFGLYVLAAVLGALLAVAAGTALPAASIPVAGAMGAVLAVICCVATLNPDRGIGLLIIGVVPMKWVAVAFVTISVLFAFGAWPYVAVYLGGAAVGVGFAKAQLAGTDLAAWARGLFSARPGPYGGSRASSPSERKGVLARLDSWAARRSGPEAPRPEAAAPRRSVRGAPREVVAPPDVIDRILDKISEQGYDALTDEEKRTLYEASKKG